IQLLRHPKHQQRGICFFLPRPHVIPPSPTPRKNAARAVPPPRKPVILRSDLRVRAADAQRRRICFFRAFLSPVLHTILLDPPCLLRYRPASTARNFSSSPKEPTWTPKQSWNSQPSTTPRWWTFASPTSPASGSTSATPSANCKRTPSKTASA